MATSAKEQVDALAAALRQQATPERASYEKGYLKSDLEFYGATLPVINKLAIQVVRSQPDLTPQQLISLVEESWSRGVHDLRALAAELLSLRHDLLGLEHVSLLERLLREAKTWALVDGIAPYAVGRLLEREPGLTKTLDRWAKDDDFWLRRAVLLAYLLPMREGKEVFASFARYADAMLGEREFFIRKAIGWVLRDRTKKRPDEVFEWLLPRAARASGLTLREAGKRLSEEQRAALSAAASRFGIG